MILMLIIILNCIGRKITKRYITIILHMWGSTITNDNKTSIYNGAFSPAFDLDLGFNC